MLEVFVQTEHDRRVDTRRVAVAPDLAHGTWLQEGEHEDRLAVEPQLDLKSLDFRVRLGGSSLVRRGLVPSEQDQIEVRLDPYGQGRRELPKGANGERVLLVVQTDPLAHPVFEGGVLVDFRPDPRILPGV